MLRYKEHLCRAITILPTAQAVKTKKKKKKKPFVAIWMDRQIAILSECSQSKKDKYHSTAYVWRRRHWQPSPVLLPGKSHGLRSLVECSPWGH